MKGDEIIKGIGEQLYRTLKQRIVALEMQPGERINFSDLSREFGVSLSPLREAVKKLCESRLVEFFPRRGYYIFKPAVEDVKNIYELRRMFEHHALNSFNKSNQDDKNLRKLKKLGEAVLGKGEEKKRAILLETEQIHIFTISHSENTHMKNLFRSIYDFTLFFQHMVERDIERFIGEHIAMADALLKGDIKKAHQLVDEHTDAAIREICRALQVREKASKSSL
ncbi:GntR family transcriptional regulator [Candidatus Aerophobetes bacterium]|nr:GntR family transcriptional regulator [Candidatus Aerophobetes bacterium]